MNRADLNGLRTFLAIVECGTLRAAGDDLGVNPSAVSQQLKGFEEALGSALFVRSTRSVALTDTGQALYERTHHLMDEIDAALDATRHAARSTSGQLRITLPYRAWQLALAPRITAFQDHFPEIELDLSIDEELTDIVANGYHAGIRLGDYLADEMIAVALTKPLDGAFVASKEYLQRHGVPKRPADLLGHDCIRYRQIASKKVASWQFEIDGMETRIEVSGRLIFSDLRSVIDAAAQGLGIGWSLREGVAAQIESGELIEVLRDYTPHRPRFYLYFPRQLRDMTSLRAFIDHFAIGA
ncbi:LysR family transcriptional regulator [Jannaschia sp. CCS1]|uniref:LysR family transcriptional regulator n=1 Tax=Jannaschia sp. (strain CCS1) TaxID=290400 RepID=UPI000053C2B0|nr:LysR family transcriptional regulator [Jannaschia sp. CCS1]ABD54085.1 transcriptional regulator, LysR family [Jannaschia sp. CCS1]